MANETEECEFCGNDHESRECDQGFCANCQNVLDNCDCESPAEITAAELLDLRDREWRECAAAELPAVADLRSDHRCALCERFDVRGGPAIKRGGPRAEWLCVECANPFAAR